jgi:hypothetical protein
VKHIANTEKAWVQTPPFAAFFPVVDPPIMPKVVGSLTGGKKHIDKQTFKQMFRDHWDAFKLACPLYNTSYHDEVVQKMLNCGDPDKMGFAQYRCTFCGDIRRIAFSCKSSFCLSCCKVYTDRWADFIGRRMLPGVTYRHIVLTVPDFLHPWFYRNPGKLLSPFMRAGNACLLDVFATSAGVPLDIGSIIVLQTAGRSGNYNPHLHILVTEGGITKQSTWKSVSYIPFEVIHRKWQYYLLNMLRENISDPRINADIDRAWTKYPKGLVAFVDKGEVPPGGQGLAIYLAKYVVSPPISVRRIQHYDGKTVKYWYRDHRSGQIEYATLPVLRFIGRMIQHILPKGFQRIRYYGLHGNVRYEKVRTQLAKILPHDLPANTRGFRVLPRKPFVQLFLETFDRNPLICPRCHQIMELELIYHPAHGTIKTFELYEEPPHELSTPFPAASGSPIQRSQPVVQLSLPFL